MSTSPTLFNTSSSEATRLASPQHKIMMNNKPRNKPRNNNNNNNNNHCKKVIEIEIVNYTSKKLIFF
jgi:hypothetical protein